MSAAPGENTGKTDRPKLKEGVEQGRNVPVSQDRCTRPDETGQSKGVQKRQAAAATRRLVKAYWTNSAVFLICRCSIIVYL